MIAELKRIAEPVLRNTGFRGSFPHYRRTGEQFIDFVSFQFSRYGGSFVVEAVRCPETGITKFNGSHIAANDVRIIDMLPRKRLRPADENQDASDYWFDYTLHAPSDIACTVKAVFEQANLWTDVPIFSGPSKQH